jgi:hypothetical protein
MASNSINRAGEVGVLTNSGVAAADTLDGLDAFANSFRGHADQQPYVSRVKQAWRVSSVFTNAAVLNLTTVAALALLASPSAQLGLLPND